MKKLSLYSTLNGNYAGIEEFNEMTDLQIHMHREKNAGTANKWEISREGANHHFEGVIDTDGSIDIRRVPPLK